MVLDTNILVAGLRSRLGASARVLDLVGRGLIQINVSVPVVLEYEAVLKRPGIVPAYTPRDVDQLLDGLCALAHHQDIFYLWRPQLPDPADEFILELAVAADRASIVTFNANHFRRAQLFGVRVLAPRDLLTEIGAIE
ncbi:MAG TPA: PIN domain-containing protein [Gemmatimonadaceae bacterium]